MRAIGKGTGIRGSEGLRYEETGRSLTNIVGMQENAKGPNHDLSRVEQHEKIREGQGEN